MGQKNSKKKELKHISRVAVGIDVHKKKCAVYVVDADPGPTPDDVQAFNDELNVKFRRVDSTTNRLAKRPEAMFLIHPRGRYILLEDCDVFLILKQRRDPLLKG